MFQLFQRIQLTATTPTNSAVRLETGAVEFELSNRVENVSGAVPLDSYMKIFGKATVDINLSLGQLLKNVLFEEAEPEFQQYAFFKTRIGMCRLPLPLYFDINTTFLYFEDFYVYK